MFDQILDTSALDEILIRRVKPYIYSFLTGTIPNYLKVTTLCAM